MKPLSRRSFLRQGGRGAGAAAALPALTGTAGGAEACPPEADLALVGGRILTVNPTDEIVEAVAIAGNRIAGVGSRDAVTSLIGPATRVIDLGGRTALPGFVENHIHMTNSPQNTWINVRPEAAPSIEAIRELVAERVRELPPGQWVMAFGYHPERLKEKRHPDRRDLDPVSPRHPVAIKHREGMSWTFNTLGLRRLGVQDNTPDPPGGPLSRDEDGAPLGPLFDNARSVFVAPALPAPTEEELLEGYRWMCGELNRHGITSACEAGIREPEELAAWRRLREEGGLSVRVNLGPYPVSGADWSPESVGTRLHQAGLYSGFGDEWLRVGSLTYGVDGGLFGQTMALFEPYSNRDGEYRGSFRVTPEVADSFSLAAQGRGWQISAVCHGDHGISVALDAVEKAQRAHPGRHLRHRLEHAYVWNPELLRRAADLGIVWNTQLPIMAAAGRGPTIDALGPRSRHAFPVRTAMELGIPISGGSDWTVATLDPMVGLHALVTRRLEPLEEGEVLNPGEAVSVLEAVRMYTYNGAYAVFEEAIKGSLEVGKLADIAVLSEDLLAVSPERIRDLKVVLTLVDGRIVHETEGVLERVGALAPSTAGRTGA